MRQQHRQSVLLLTVTLTAVGALAAGETEDDILDIGHVEEVTSSLVQVPVLVAGSGDLYRLSQDDLEIWIGDRRLEQFRIDILEEITRSRPRPVIAGRKAPARFVQTYQQRPVGATTRTFVTTDSCGNSKTVRVPVRPRTRTMTYTSSAPAAPVTRTSLPDSEYSVLSLISINAVDDPPSPALRVVSRNKFRRLQPAPLGTMDVPSLLPVRAALVPMDFDGRVYKALAQVSVPDPGPGAASWDISVWIEAGNTTSIVWGRIEAKGGEQRLVLQDTLTIPSGDYTLIARARNEETGETRTDRLTGTLLKPKRNRAALADVAVFQLGGATILKAGHALASSGGFVLAADETLAPDREQVLLASLCRAPGDSDVLTVDRSLIGTDEVALPTTELEPTGDRCSLLAHHVPAGLIEPGQLVYRVRVSDSEGMVAERQRELHVAGMR